MVQFAMQIHLINPPAVDPVSVYSRHRLTLLVFLVPAARNNFNDVKSMVGLNVLTNFSFKFNDTI